MNGNKKGFALVEAAIIYPLVIGAVMSIIYIMISMYTAGAVRSNLNAELRQVALSKTKTGERIELQYGFVPRDKYGKKAFSQKILMGEDSEKGVKVLHGYSVKTYEGNGIITENTTRKHSSSVYLIDEKEFMRKVDMIQL